MELKRTFLVGAVGIETYVLTRKLFLERTPQESNRKSGNTCCSNKFSGRDICAASKPTTMRGDPFFFGRVERLRVMCGCRCSRGALAWGRSCRTLASRGKINMRSLAWLATAGHYPPVSQSRLHTPNQLNNHPPQSVCAPWRQIQQVDPTKNFLIWQRLQIAQRGTNSGLTFSQVCAIPSTTNATFILEIDADYEKNQSW